MTISRSARSAKGPPPGSLEPMALAAPEADRPPGAAGEDHPDACALREGAGQTRIARVDRLQEHRLGGVDEVDERVRAGRDHPDAGALARLANVEVGLESELRPPRLEGRALGRRRDRARRLGGAPAEHPLEEGALERLPAAHDAIRRGRGLTVVREDEEVVAMLGHAAEDAADLAERAVDAAQGGKGLAAPRAEGVGDLVVVQVVDVDRRHAVVDVARDRAREPLADPHRDGDPLLGELPFPLALTRVAGRCGRPCGRARRR